jgi:hypothetical protein
MIQEKNYLVLNELAEKDGTVIFGGKEDMSIPLCELKQAFRLDSKFYNRSSDNINITNAKELYESCVAPLEPDTVLLHIGENDLELFGKDPDKFISLYRELISEIRSDNKKCRIAIVSLKNYDGDVITERLNEQLKYLADSERCEFADIAEKKIWNPIATRDAVSFAYLLGAKVQKPIYDLAKILFCYV